MLQLSRNNANDLYVEALKYLSAQNNLVEHKGVRYLEISPMLLINTNPKKRLITDAPRKWDESKARAEFNWYMSGSNLVEDIIKDLPRWADFSDDGVHINSAYGYLWKPQINPLVAKIKDDLYTRQAVVTLYDGNKFLSYNGKDTICTVSIQFIYRDGALHMHVNMRSNDLIWGYCNDQYSFSMLHELICMLTKLPVGTYYHYATSMHIYERHWHLLKKEK